MPKPDLRLALWVQLLETETGPVYFAFDWQCHCGFENRAVAIKLPPTVCCQKCEMEYKAALFVALTPIKEEGE